MDTPTLEERVATLEEATARFGELAVMVAGLRADVADLGGTVENHGLLLARLLDEAGGET